MREEITTAKMSMNWGDVSISPSGVDSEDERAPRFS